MYNIYVVYIIYIWKHNGWKISIYEENYKLVDPKAQWTPDTRNNEDNYTKEYQNHIS